MSKVRGFLEEVCDFVEKRAFLRYKGELAIQTHFWSFDIACYILLCGFCQRTRVSRNSSLESENSSLMCDCETVEYQLNGYNYGSFIREFICAFKVILFKSLQV